MKFFILSSAVCLGTLFLNSCGMYQMPAGYSGPTATISSTSKRVNSVKAEGYYVMSIDGKSASNSPMNTPHGTGMRVLLANETVQVPCQPLTLNLSGGNIYAADGVAMADFLIGGNHSVSGEITFTPKPGAAYSVVGTTGKSSTAVWLTDLKSGKIVSQKVGS